MAKTSKATAFARDLLASGRSFNYQLKRDQVLTLVLVLVILALGYGREQLCYISARQERILDGLVAQLAQEKDESEASIWRRVEAESGASSPLTIRRWDYDRVLDMIADEMATARPAPPGKAARL